MPKTAVIYARFSCNKQREASIDDQLRICRQWCQREINGSKLIKLAKFYGCSADELLGTWY